MEQQLIEATEEYVLTLSDPQWAVLHSPKALTLDMAGQRAGKSQMIGILTGQYVTNFPKLKGFIGANTYLQLTQSTLIKAQEIWKDYYHLTLYDRKTNPEGDYVIDRRPPSHFTSFQTYKDYNNIISFKNGHVIYVGSLDNFKAHDGKEFHYAHLDETKDTREEAVKSVILARLSGMGLYVNDNLNPDEDDDWLVYLPDADPKELPDNLRPFNPAWIHTSPAIGAVDWLVDMFQLPEYEGEIMRRIKDPEDFYLKDFDTKRVVIFSTYHNLPNLPRNYIQGRLDVLSENEALKFVYGYPFAKTGSEYFPYFERKKHVNSGYLFNPNYAAHITLDFNVMPYMTLLAAQVFFLTRYIDAQGVKFDEPAEGRLPIEVMRIQFYKEYCFSTPLNTTEDVALAWMNDHVGYPHIDLFYYGDANGNSRIPGLGSLSNYKILSRTLESYLGSESKRVGGYNIGVLLRRNLMNRIFEGKYPEIEIYFDESMIETIRDFENLKMAKDGKLKETAKDPQTGASYEKIGHTSDATEYLVCEILKHYIKEE